MPSNVVRQTCTTRIAITKARCHSCVGFPSLGNPGGGGDNVAFDARRRRRPHAQHLRAELPLHDHSPRELGIILPQMRGGGGEEKLNELLVKYIESPFERGTGKNCKSQLP